MDKRVNAELKTIDVIVPCFNEEETLLHFYSEIKQVIDSAEYDFRCLFIDDGSTDGTLNIIKTLEEENPKISHISFSRNFGKEAAMYAGFCNSNADYVAVIDSDLQDPPLLLIDMAKSLDEQHCDCVATYRSGRRGEPRIRSWFAKKFYSIINCVSDAQVVNGARDFRMMRKEMVDAIVAMSENNRFSKGIFGWVGFKTKWIEISNTSRVAGKSKWHFWTLFKYAVDGITSFSEVPLSIASWTGVFFTAISLLAILFIIIRWLCFGDPVAGWASTLCVIIFIGGIQLFCTGILGQYLAKTFSETKKRPHYIISDTNVEEVTRVN